jgi:hypothetical protein
MKKDKKIKIKPVKKLTFWRKVTSMLYHHCSYCGKRYVNIHSEDINLFCPLPQNGKGCPDGHEGYIIERGWWVDVVHRFDFME